MKFLEFIYESYDLKVQSEEIENIDNDFINDLIDNLSFIYKKRKDKYIRPKTIKGNMLNNIKLNIVMYNKDIIEFDYLDGNLKVEINGDIVYDMEGIDRNLVPKKIHNIYTKHLTNLNYKIIIKNNDI